MTVALRSVTIAALCLFASGVPRLVATALGGGEPECASDCDGSFGSKRCAPNCDDGPCAKCPSAVEPPRLELSAVEVFQVAAPTPLSITGSEAARGRIFHPPKA